MSNNNSSGEELVELAGSHRSLPETTGTLIDAPAEDVATVTVVLRRKNELPDDVARGHRRLSRDELAATHGADPADIDRVRAFAQGRGLQVADADVASRRVMLQGSLAALQQAFGVRLRTVEGTALRLREGPVMIPAGLQDAILGVFGLDNRPQARPHIVTQAEKAASQPGFVPADYTATNLAALYNFPSGVNGSGQVIGILELGGGYQQSDLNAYFSSIGETTPSVTAVSVDKATNNPGKDSDADGEVALDIEVAGGTAPGAKIAVYFAPNSSQGFLDAASTAIHDTVNKPSIISISWGAAESTWTGQAMQSMETTFTDAAALGICVLVAAGDHGSADSQTDGLAHVDFPASCPHATGCGGTHLNSSGNTITSEVVWNDNNGIATGGGVSDEFGLPAWQQGAGVPASVNSGHRIGRGVPDVAGAADVSPGFRIYVDGGFQTLGGTSGVAPLWAGLIARINQALGHDVGFLNALIYARQAGLGGFHDITSGNNGAYSAVPGWDACTGFGSPDGTDLLNALRGPYPLTWQLAGNTTGFGNISADPFFTGDFTGAGKTDIMFYSPGDSNWWLATMNNGTLAWQKVGNTAGFGNISTLHFWTGDFAGTGHQQIMFYYPGDGNWWHGTITSGNLTWQNAGNTAGFGNISGLHFWTGNFTGTGHSQVMFYYPGDGNWWFATLS